MDAYKDINGKYMTMSGNKLPVIGERIEVERPTWIQTHLMMSIIVAMRSDDAQTKCGCVLTTADHTILSTGFNGFIRGANPTLLPNVRPEKYPFMIHGEMNALLNCARMGKSTINGIAYISGQPCVHCTQSLIQAGIKYIYYTNWSTPKMVEDEMETRNILRFLNLISMNFIDVEEIFNFFKILHPML